MATTRSLEQDFQNLYMNEREGTAHVSYSSPSPPGSYSPHNQQTAGQHLANGLPAFKPVEDPNEFNPIQSITYHRPGSPTQPRQVYGSPQTRVQPQFAYMSQGGHHPVNRRAPLPGGGGSPLSPHRMHADIDFPTPPPSTTPDSYYSDDDYMVPVSPKKMGYGSIAASFNPQADKIVTSSYTHPVRPREASRSPEGMPVQRSIPVTHLDKSHGRLSPQPQQTMSEKYGTEKYPVGVRSQLLYTAPTGVTSGYVQSRPTNIESSSPPPHQAPSPPSHSYDSSPTSPTSRFPESPSPTRSQPQEIYAYPSKVLGPPQGQNAVQAKAVPQNVNSDSKSGPTSPKEKEAEIDALTNLLVQNMEAAGDPDFYGTCHLCNGEIHGRKNACIALEKLVHIECFRCMKCGMCGKCGRAIMGENQGCSALDQLYHLHCFVCIECGVCLGGQPFFAMEGKPHCETCYLNTLEKCSVCSQPITDRILRATGKPYHPKCFTCVVCGKSLDGVPFTVDATNQIHCIEDFHKKFAPRCCVCGMPIMPEVGNEETVRIVAMDKSFHTACYKCEDCGMTLSSEAEGRGCYPLDDLILCKNCNAHRIQAMTTKMTTEL